MITPGVYRNLSFGEYLSLAIPSSSALKVGHNVSMRHMKDAIEGNLKDKDSKDRKFGRALHAYVLEPERFKTDYVIQKHCMGQTKPKKKGDPVKDCTNWATRKNHDTGKWYCGVHGKGLEECENMVTGSSLADIEGAGKAIENHELIQQVRAVGFPEYTLITEVEGVLVKVRYDFFSANIGGRRTIVDLKKISEMSGSEEKLQRTIEDYDYDLQAALYVEAHRAHFGAACDFLWVFVEGWPPYSVIPRYLSDAYHSIGWAKARSTLDRWKECVEWERFPGYDDEPQEILPPDWLAKRYGVAAI